MSHSASSFAKGIATGLVVGAAMTMFIDPISDRKKNKLQKKTENIFKNIGGLIDTAMDMMK